MSTIVEHLTHFAKDQLAVLPGWTGQHYVEKCLALWAQEYGLNAAQEVRRALGASLTRRGPG
jgi:hypothetical protein